MRFDDKALFDLEPEQQSPEARREIMEHLLKSVRDIEAQLGSKNKTDMSGNRLTPADYVRWRQNAIRAMNHRVTLYRKYKSIEKASQNVQEKTSATTSPAEVLARPAASEDTAGGDSSSDVGGGAEGRAIIYSGGNLFANDAAFRAAYGAGD